MLYYIYEGEKDMNIFGRGGLLYNTLAIVIYLAMPLVLLILIPVMWIYEKIMKKEF